MEHGNENAIPMNYAWKYNDFVCWSQCNLYNGIISIVIKLNQVQWKNVNG